MSTPKIRIGNTTVIEWEILQNPGEAPYDLTEKNLTLLLSSSFTKLEVSDYLIEGNLLTWTFEGKDQKYTGKYSLTLIENSGQLDMHTVDSCNAFELVNCSCQEEDGDSNVTVKRLRLTSKIKVGGFGGSGVSEEQVEEIIGLMIPHDFNNDFNEDFAI